MKGRGANARLERGLIRARAIAGRITPRGLLIANVVVWLGVGVLWQRCGVGGCPTVARLASYQPGGASVLLDRDGEPFADLSPIDHEVVPLDALPDHVSAAFIAVEDQRFHEHSGLDLRRVGGAMVANLRARGFAQGFSTITMQLARNVWPETLPGQERTLQRKILEVRVARAIEREFTKPEILELYLNNIYFGSGAYGIEAAARNYFGKPAAELRLSEAATLAAMPKSPVLYNPRRYEERARERRNLVLRLMAEQERISSDDARAAQVAPLDVRRDPPTRRVDERLVAPYFAEAVRRVLEDRLGETIYTTRLEVHTTLDRDAQRTAERQLERQLDRIEAGRHGAFDGDTYRSGSTEEPDYLQGAVVVLEAATGDVLALVGGRDYAQSRFDRATRARRQAGSAFKPFVYAAALAQGFAPSQRIKDDTLRMELEGGEIWVPQNYTGDYRGFVTLRQALVASRNVPTIRLAQDVGLDNVERLAERAGIRSEIPNVPSAAIGVAAVTPLELTAAYTAFANSGIAAEPRFVTHVVNGVDEIVWDNEPDTDQVLRPEVAYLITDMLTDAVDVGTASAVRDAGFRSAAAGKTGTTDEGMDAWFVGYTPDLVAGVWIGFDRPRAIVGDASGGDLAAPLWGRLMADIYEGRSTPEPWPRPEDITEQPIDPSTGLLLVEGCHPETGSAESELFIAGDEPAATCPAGTPTADTRGFLARAGDWFARAWRRTTHFLATHFGSEEAQPIPPRGEERYLGTPRLPRAVEIADPVVPVDSFRPERELVIPVLDSLAPSSSLARDTTPPLTDPIEPADTLQQDRPSPAAPSDTAAAADSTPPVAAPDTTVPPPLPPTGDVRPDTISHR